MAHVTRGASSWGFGGPIGLTESTFKHSLPGFLSVWRFPSMPRHQPSFSICRPSGGHLEASRLFLPFWARTLLGRPSIVPWLLHLSVPGTASPRLTAPISATFSRNGSRAILGMDRGLLIVNLDYCPIEVLLQAPCPSGLPEILSVAL